MRAGLALPACQRRTGARAAANIRGMHKRSFLDFIRQEMKEPPASVQVLGSTLITLKVSKFGGRWFGDIGGSGSVLVLIQI